MNQKLLKYGLIVLFLLLVIVPVSGKISDGTELHYSLYANSTDRPRPNPSFQWGLDDRVNVIIYSVADDNYTINSPVDFWGGHIKLDYFSAGLQIGGFIDTSSNRAKLSQFGDFNHNSFTAKVTNSNGAFFLYMEWGSNGILNHFSYAVTIKAVTQTITLDRLPTHHLGFYVFGIPVTIISTDSQIGLFVQVIMLITLLFMILLILPLYSKSKNIKWLKPISEKVIGLFSSKSSGISDLQLKFQSTENGKLVGKVSTVMFLGYLWVGIINSYVLTIPGMIKSVDTASHYSFYWVKMINAVVNYLFAINILYFTIYLRNQFPDFVDTRKLSCVGILTFLSSIFGTTILFVGSDGFVLGQFRIFNLISLIGYYLILNYLYKTILFADGAFRFTIRPKGLAWVHWYFAFTLIPAVYSEIVYQRIAGGLYPIYMFGIFFFFVYTLIMLVMMLPDWLRLPKSLKDMKQRTHFKVPLFSWEEMMRIKLLPPAKGAEESVDGELKLTQVFEDKKVGTENNR